MDAHCSVVMGSYLALPSTPKHVGRHSMTVPAFWRGIKGQSVRSQAWAEQRDSDGERTGLEKKAMDWRAGVASSVSDEPAFLTCCSGGATTRCRVERKTLLDQRAGGARKQVRSSPVTSMTRGTS